MRSRILLSLLLMTLAPTSSATEPELMATLSVMGYGYKVSVAVNGADLGIQGGKSEGRRLFNRGHEMEAKAPPAIRQRTFVLVRGTNELAIEYAKLAPGSTDRLEITLEAEGYPAPLLRLVSETTVSDKRALKIDIADKAPAGFRPVEIVDTK